MLKLSDSELDIVLAAAQPLAAKDRDAFLQDVAAALAALPSSSAIVPRSRRLPLTEHCRRGTRLSLASTSRRSSAPP
jgi:hypothetical protein